MRLKPIVLAALLFLPLAACSAGGAPMPPAGAVPAYAPAAKIPARDVRGAELDGHQLIAENDRWEMYLREDTLSIIMRCKETGAVMASTVSEPNEPDNNIWKGFYQSGVIMEYIQGTNLDNTSADLVYTAHEKSIAYWTDGFSARVTFPEISIAYELTVTLNEDGFTAEIPQSSITEGDDRYTVGAFYLYPFLGHTRLGEDEGYMFIPDGQGALIELKDNERRYLQPYSAPFYGPDVGIDAPPAAQMTDFGWGPIRTINREENILIPCYGMVHTAKGIGYLAIIEEGAGNASLKANPNGTTTVFDWISAQFIYRQIYRQPTGNAADSGTIAMRTDRANRFDMKTRFCFVTGTDADYAALAVRYRDYLEDSGAFANAGGTEYRTQVDFFGQEKKNWAFLKVDVNMTSFRQAADILDDLAAAGAGPLLSVYKAWYSGGYYGGLPTDAYSPAFGLGGKGGLSSLSETAQKNGVLLALELDLLRVNPATRPMMAMDALKRITRRTYFDRDDFGGLVYDEMNFLNPFRSLELARSSSFGKSAAELLCLTGTANHLSSFYYKSAYYDRSDSIRLYDRLTAAFAEKKGVLLDRPFLPQWAYAQALVNLPSADSGFIYTTQEVPFLSIALSGKIPYYNEYVNFQANQANFRLMLAEQGARPAFLLTHGDPVELQTTNSDNLYSSQYGLYKEQVLTYDREFSELHRQIGGASIIGHRADGGLVTITYDNGLRVYVNYGDAPVTAGGVSVGAKDFGVVSGNG